MKTLLGIFITVDAAADATIKTVRVQGLYTDDNGQQGRVDVTVPTGDTSLQSLEIEAVKLINATKTSLGLT